MKKKKKKVQYPITFPALLNLSNTHTHPTLLCVFHRYQTRQPQAFFGPFWPIVTLAVASRTASANHIGKLLAAVAIGMSAPGGSRRRPLLPLRTALEMCDATNSGVMMEVPTLLMEFSQRESSAVCTQYGCTDVILMKGALYLCLSSCVRPAGSV